jgi:tetratricopeptide (TPR) repeat protein
MTQPVRVFQRALRMLLYQRIPAKSCRRSTIPTSHRMHLALPSAARSSALWVCRTPPSRITTRPFASDPHFAKAYAGRAVANLALGNGSAADADTETAIACGMDAAQVRAVLNGARESLGGSGPEDLARILLNEAAYYQSRARWADALASFEAVLKNDPASPEALIGRGLTLLSLDRADDALTSFTDALEHDPGNGRALLGRAGAHARRGESEKADHDLDGAIAAGIDKELARKAIAEIAHDPDRGRAEDLRRDAQKLAAANRLEEAIAAYSEAIATDPADVRGYSGRAVVSLTAGEPEQALNDYAEAIRLEPERAESYAGRAVAFTVLRDDEAGESDVDRAVALGMGRDEVNSVVSSIRGRRVHAVS